MSNTVDVTAITDFSTLKKMAEEGDLWVINNTDKLSVSGARGILTFGVKDANGDVVAVVLGDTWIPINIATRCDPVLCVASQHFRDSIGKRAMVVISAEEAKSMLNSDAARREQKDVESRLGNNEVLKTVKTTDSKISISTNKSAVQMQVTAQPDLATASSGNSDDRALLRLVTDFNDGNVSSDEACAALLKLNPTLDGAKIASGEVLNSGSEFATQLGDIISELA